MHKTKKMSHQTSTSIEKLFSSYMSQKITRSLLIHHQRLCVLFVFVVSSTHHNYHEQYCCVRNSGKEKRSHSFGHNVPRIRVMAVGGLFCPWGDDEDASMNCMDICRNARWWEGVRAGRAEAQFRDLAFVLILCVLSGAVALLGKIDLMTHGGECQDEGGTPPPLQLRPLARNY